MIVDAGECHRATRIGRQGERERGPHAIRLTRHEIVSDRKKRSEENQMEDHKFLKEDCQASVFKMCLKS